MKREFGNVILRRSKSLWISERSRRFQIKQNRSKKVIGDADRGEGKMRGGISSGKGGDRG
jgi:hypothetical protein